MSGLAVLISCCLVVVACTSSNLNVSPPPTTGPGPTPLPTVGPSPTIGAPDERGFPTSILGLPVHTVAGMHQLANVGKLDGRFVAVAGYWKQLALPCAYQPHLPVLLGYCAGGAFEDTIEAAQGGNNRLAAPVIAPETSGSIGSPSDVTGQPQAVVLIVHAADSRTWQCAAQDRATCHARLVIDEVAWIDGSATGVAADVVAPGAVKPGEQIVTAFATRLQWLDEVDPRLMGLGVGTVTYLGSSPARRTQKEPAMGSSGWSAVTRRQ